MKKKISKINFNNPHVFLILAALFWGFNAIAGRSAVGEISPLLIVTSRWSNEYDNAKYKHKCGSTAGGLGVIQC